MFLLDPVENILVYFREFGGKPCCFDDLHIFLSVLSKDQIREMLKCMTAIVEENPIDYDCKEEDLRTNVNLKISYKPHTIQKYCSQTT